MAGEQGLFFAKLPKATLSPLEVRLRESLLRTAALAAELLPRSGAVSIQDWVEYRMPDELVLRANARGRVVLVSLVGNEVPESSHDSGGNQATSLGQKKGWPLRMQASELKARQPRAPLDPPPAKRARGGPEAFLNSLPIDSFSDDELRLREAVLAFLCARPDQKTETLLDCSCDVTVKQAQTDCLPTDCPLKDWIENRLGDEVIMEQDATGQLLLRPTKEAINWHRHAEALEAQEPFFESLPSDSYTAEEEQLQVAIEDFLKSWPRQDPPTLSDLGNDPAIRNARTGLFPPLQRGDPGRITLSAWLHRRSLNVFDVVEIPPVSVIGLKGTVDEETAIRLVEEQKRRRAAGLNATASYLNRNPQIRTDRLERSRRRTDEAMGFAP